MTVPPALPLGPAAPPSAHVGDLRPLLELWAGKTLSPWRSRSRGAACGAAHEGRHGWTTVDHAAT